MIAVDTAIHLEPDPGRVIVRFFVPGLEDVGPGDSRAAPLIERVLALDESAVRLAVEELRDRSGERWPMLLEIFHAHAATVAARIERSSDELLPMSDERMVLLGASFTHEFAVEGAALCNPSVVLHPDQPDDGTVALLMSVRGIGEGHRSSIGFRVGHVDAEGGVTVAAPGPSPVLAGALPGRHHRSVFERWLGEQHGGHDNAAFVLDPLPDVFDDAQLAERVAALDADAATRRPSGDTIAALHELTDASYRVVFDPRSHVSERILWPSSRHEQHGMEDARFVEITDGSAPRYCATYTAFDGTEIRQHLLTTDDFRSFDVGPMAGIVARSKGLALFPRQLDGRFVALSRADRESNSVALSHDLRGWDSARTVQTPRHPWEILQLGNCGSPVETADGWLVLTHGVGPMRTYSIGAVLLDLHDPHRMIAACERPIITPATTDRGGYVPNVVYTCGAVEVAGRLVIPYGVGDRSIRVATVSIADLLASMRPIS
jgi:predicted GH43/DUF377 family glycosyl hydrolase